MSERQLLQKSLQILKATLETPTKSTAGGKKKKKKGSKSLLEGERESATAAGSRDWTQHNLRTLAILRKSAKLPERLRDRLLAQMRQTDHRQEERRARKTHLMGLKSKRKLELPDKMAPSSSISKSESESKSVFSDDDFEKFAMEFNPIVPPQL